MSQQPTGKLAEALSHQSPERRSAFMDHFTGGTSAEYLSDWLTRTGHPVGKSAIKEQRRRLRGE